jgi:hypothetical protein
MRKKELLLSSQSDEVPKPANVPDGTQEAQRRAEKFLEDESRFLSAYTQEIGLQFEPGKWWATDMEKGIVYYNLKHFGEQKFSRRDGFLHLLHEIDAHLREIALDPKTVEQANRRMKRDPRLQLLRNVVEDAAGDRKTAARFPMLVEARREQYRTKLFPQRDFRTYEIEGQHVATPKHVQFANAIKWESRMPKDEPVAVDPEVRQALDGLRSIQLPSGEIVDILDLATTPSISLADRTRLTRHYIEEAYLKLFEEDKNDPQFSEQGRRKGSDEPSSAKTSEGEESERERKEKGKSGVPEIFKRIYEEEKKKHPEPFSEEDEEKITEHLKKQHADRNKHAGRPDDKLKTYAREHGVTPEDIQRYRSEYERTVKEHVERLVGDVFERILTRRVMMRRRFRGLHTEGGFIEPALMSQAYTDSKSGIEEPSVWRKPEFAKQIEKAVGGFDIHLVSDLSGSMDISGYINPARHAAMLVMEAWRLFTDRILEREEREGLDLGLIVRSEIRSFSQHGEDTELLKALSPDLSEQVRLKAWKSMREAHGSQTADYLPLEEIERSLSEDDRQRIRNGELRKLVVVLSDGVSSNRLRVNRAIERLRRVGTIVVRIGMGESSVDANDPYQPDVQAVPDMRNFTETLRKTLEPHIESL